MSKGKKQAPNGLVFLKGLLLSLGTYLLGQLLVTLLVVKGAIGEESVFPAAAIFCFLSALAGGALCARRPMWGRLPSAMLCAALFAAVLAAIGILCWGEGITWTGHGGILILCALTGGLTAGILGGGHKRRKKRKSAAL